MLRTRLLYAVLCLVVAVMAGAGTASSDVAFDTRMDAFVGQALERLDVVPGFALAVVKDGEVLYIHSFGHRDVAAGLEVTPQTSFYIASSTKSFTGMAASVLVGEGVLDLDAPVTRYLPGLELPAPLSADSVTVLQLLTHTTGVNNVPVQKQLAFVDALSLDEFYAMMLEHSTPMPPRFIYTNLGYNVMGYVLEQVTEEPWQDVVQERVFDAVGMTNTSTSLSLVPELALPYAKRGDDYVAMEMKNQGMMHAAGGVVASVADLADWVRANLGDGMVDGRQALPADAVARAHHSYATLERPYYEFQRTGYGLGWYHSRYDGDLLMHHFGGFDGFHAHVSFMPEHGMGAVALMNTDEYGSSTLAHMVAAYAYDLLLGKDDVDATYAGKLDALVAEVTARKQLGDGMRHAEALHDRGESEAMGMAVATTLEAAVRARVLDESGINRMGYQYLGDEKPALAIAVLQLILAHNPDDANAHDSLGEAYEASGDLERALELYAKAVTLSDDPELTATIKGHIERANSRIAAGH